MPRVLFYSPYTNWLPHSLWEFTLALGLRQRGGVVRFIHCGGLPDCGIHPKIFGRPEDICALCRSNTEHLMATGAFDHRYVPQPTEIGARLRRWVDSLSNTELREAQWKGLPLGEWVHATLVGIFSQPHLDTSEPNVASEYRDHLYGAALVAEGLPALIEEFQPDAAVLLNGAFFLHRTAFEILRARGIRVITHERGFQNNTLIFNLNEPIWHANQFAPIWKAWKHIPLNAQELNRVDKVLQDRRKGHNMGWYAFSPALQERAELMKRLGLPDKPTALLCTSVESETSLAGLSLPISQDAWIEATIAYFARRPDLSLVIRCHPGDADSGNYASLLRPQWEARRQSLPANVTLILPHEEISTYSLMEMAGLCLTYGSTVGLEMACMGLPVVHCGAAHYKHAGFTFEFSDLGSYPALLAEAMGAPRSVERRRLAYRFAYHYYHTLTIPFQKVWVDPEQFHLARLNYSGPSQLNPGQDADLDRILNFILDEGDLYPSPDAERRAADTSVEDRFFAETRIPMLCPAA